MKLTNAALLAGVALHMLAIGMNAPAKAQDAAARIDDLQPNIPADAKLLLTANELVYNRDTEKVTVRGNVQIEYGGYKMVARQVDYDQKSGRILATGDIQLIEPGGNIVYADRMDVTDDFGNGFVQALRIETTDLTRLAARPAKGAMARNSSSTRPSTPHALRATPSRNIALCGTSRPSASFRTDAPVPFGSSTPISNSSASRSPTFR